MCLWGEIKKNQWDAGNLHWHYCLFQRFSKIFKACPQMPGNCKKQTKEMHVWLFLMPLPSQNWDLKLGNGLNCVYQLEIGLSSLCLTNGLVKTKRSIAKDINFMLSQLFFLLKYTLSEDYPQRQHIFNIKTSKAKLSALDWGALSGNVEGSSTTSACEKLWNQNRMRHCSLQLPSLGSSETNGNS